MEVIKEFARRYYQHDVGRSSAALTYYLVFAALPLLVFFSALLGMLELDPESVLRSLDRLLPADVENLVRSYLTYVRENQSPQLMWFSLIFSVWFPMRATNCLLRSMKLAFDVPLHSGSVLLEQLRSLLFSIWTLVTLVASTLLVVVGRRALVWLGNLITLPPWLVNMWNGLRFVLLAMVLLLSLGILYMVALGARRPLRDVMPGVVISLLAWMILSAAFSYYVENFATYSRFYGTVATAVVTLLWLYMCAVVIIMGAEVNAVLLGHRKERKE